MLGTPLMSIKTDKIINIEKHFLFKSLWRKSKDRNTFWSRKSDRHKKQRKRRINRSIEVYRLKSNNKRKNSSQEKDTKKSSLQPGLWNSCCTEPESIALAIRRLSPTVHQYLFSISVNVFRISFIFRWEVKKIIEEKHFGVK
jgi:hypothetical protein